MPSDGEHPVRRRAGRKLVDRFPEVLDARRRENAEQAHSRAMLGAEGSASLASAARTACAQNVSGLPVRRTIPSNSSTSSFGRSDACNVRCSSSSSRVRRVWTRSPVSHRVSATCAERASSFSRACRRRRRRADRRDPGSYASSSPSRNRDADTLSDQTGPCVRRRARRRSLPARRRTVPV